MSVTQNSIPVMFIFHPTSLCYFDLVPPSWFFPSCSYTMSNKVDLFYTFLSLLSIPRTQSASIVSILFISLSFPSFSSFPFPSFAPCCIPAIFPYYLPLYILFPTLLSVSFPSLPLPQIQLDSNSLPGLNHQGPLVGPNHESVSPQRGFCLLTVETTDLHALCLWSVPRHLEAVEVITLICLTRRVTAHSRSAASPLAADNQGCSVLDVPTAVVYPRTFKSWM